ncbi:MAG TPA: ATPase, T2SS/T4P/T4SS family [Acidimicrobiia bacterium]|nr:ATPase, T2SS/T4P/T4SS family [Acidimicrobiia bacterium]
MTTDVYETLRRRALDRIDGTGLDPTQQPEAVRELLEATVEEYQRTAHLGRGKSLADPGATVERLVRSITGNGPLTQLLARGDVEEIFIEGDQVTYLEAGGALRSASLPTTEAENRQAIEQLMAATDRRLDASSPIAQARILEGSARLTAVIPPVGDRLSATIRKYALRRQTLDSLVELGSLTQQAADFLELAMAASASVIISGPPGAGKTSFLSALISAVPIDHCIRACEEVRELHVPLVHGSYYEARPPSLDGSGEITLRDLVKVTLAMRPDVIVVGEVRGAEAFELTRAVNAGCGLACTIHANSAPEALDALVNAALMAGENVPERVVRKVFSSSIDLVIHLDRSWDQSGMRVLRQMTEIRAVVPALHDDFSSEPIFARSRIGAPLEWSGALPPARLSERLERAGGPGAGGLRSVLEHGARSW